MAEIKDKKEALDKLAKLDEKILKRLAELSDNPKAMSYFSSPINFAIVKAFLNK